MDEKPTTKVIRLRALDGSYLTVERPLEHSEQVIVWGSRVFVVEAEPSSSLEPVFEEREFWRAPEHTVRAAE